MANSKVPVSFIVAILAAIVMMTCDALDTAVPGPMEPTFSSRETARLRSRYGLRTFDGIQEFKYTWYNYYNARPRPFTLTAKQALWLATLTSSSSQASETPFILRREYRQLSSSQRIKFHKAITAMKNSMIDGMSEYDILVKLHSVSPAAHGGAAFLPWHREYLMRFEGALQIHDSSVALPYWDSELDGFLPRPEDSIMWSNSFMGDNTGLVTSGPFANWNVIQDCHFINSKLKRAVGSYPSSALIDASDVNLVNGTGGTTFTDLASAPFSFESAHDGPHLYVGGHMGHPICSPCDPIFWMHHAFIDRLWEDFRQNIQNGNTDLETEYPTQSASVNIGGVLHNPFYIMYPFGPLVNRDGLSDHYTNNHYKYAPRPVDCSSDSDCGPFLWCHEGRCKSKIKTNGRCDGFPLNSASPCECGKCVLYGGIRRCRPSSISECMTLAPALSE